MEKGDGYDTDKRARCRQDTDKMQVVCVRKVVGHESTKTYDDEKLRIGVLCA